MGKPDDSLKMKDINWLSVDKIGFRGESRKAEDLFGSGFEAHSNEEDVVIDKPLSSATGQKIVAFTSRFTTATLFPWNNNVKNIWVYVFLARKIYSVKSNGYLSFTEQGIDKANAEMLFVDELITPGIPKEDIILAVSVTRFSYREFSSQIQVPNEIQTTLDFSDQESILPLLEAGMDYQLFHHRECGLYRLNEYQLNPNCNLPDPIKKLAEDFIKQEIEFNRNSTCQVSASPLPASGFTFFPRSDLEKTPKNNNSRENKEHFKIETDLENSLITEMLKF